MERAIGAESFAIYKAGKRELEIRRAITLDGKELVDRAGTSQVRILGRSVPNSDADRVRIPHGFE
jgi:hypothetical protein